VRCRATGAQALASASIRYHFNIEAAAWLTLLSDNCLRTCMQGGKTPPWIGEMYGYSFACAEAGLQFQVVDGLMLYPGGKLQQQLPHSDWPLILHYGGTWSVNTQSWSWAFEKSALQCIGTMHRSMVLIAWFDGMCAEWFHSDRSKIECPVRTFQQPPTFSEIPDNEGTNSLREKKVWR
jgi:hypothetical protein